MSTTTTLKINSSKTQQKTAQTTTPQTNPTKRRPVIASLRTLQKKLTTSITTTDSVLGVENITPIISPSNDGLSLVKPTTNMITSSPKSKPTFAASSKQSTKTMPTVATSTSKGKSGLTTGRKNSIPQTTRVGKASRSSTTEAIFITLSTTLGPKMPGKTNVPTSNDKRTLVHTRKLTTKSITTAVRTTRLNTKEAILTTRSSTMLAIKTTKKVDLPTSLARLLTTLKSTPLPTKKSRTQPATAAKRPTTVLSKLKLS